MSAQEGQNRFFGKKRMVRKENLAKLAASKVVQRALAKEKQRRSASQGKS